MCIRDRASGYPALDLDNPQYGYVPGPTPPMNMVSVLQRNSQYGLYLSDQAKVGNWRLTLGGRYDTLRQDKRNLLLAGTPEMCIRDRLRAGRPCVAGRC